MEVPSTSTETSGILIEGMDAVVKTMVKVWDVMLSNPLLVVFLSASLLCLGIKIFRKVKSAAKG